MATKSQTYNFKGITTIPSARKLIDIVLSQTQRKTPTEVHKQFKISRIRKFYMRKVKFCQQTCHDRLQRILSQLPQLNDIHPFYADLCNVLYDRDHYKLALGQCNSIMRVIDRIAKEYVRQMKYGTSLYRCKMLKKAALGHMCTALKRLNGSLNYLEDVRQHMSRLPSINPYTRTLLLTGYPNVGKSSFMNQVSKANVDVQPYAFTTKSLYVGHFDYNYLRWQIIDTPGLLDHPLDERNTIEMTAITALAHIFCTILFFIDVSESCGYSLEEQVALFDSIRPLFQNKPILIVLNKVDLVNFDSDRLSKLSQYKWIRTSALTGEGVDDAKITACQLLLEARLANKVNDSSPAVIEKIDYVTSVTPNLDRPPTENPKGYDEPALDDLEDEGRPRPTTEKDLELIHGGPGVYSIDLRKKHILENDEWKYDEIPEIYNGRNVIDFAYPGVGERLKLLEKEEELLLQQLQPNLEDVRSVNMYCIYHFQEEWEDLVRREDALHAKIRQWKLERGLKKKRGGPVLNETIRIKKVRKNAERRRKVRMLLPMPIDSINMESDDPKTKLEIAKGRQRESEGQPVPTVKSKKRIKLPKGTYALNDRSITAKLPKHMYSGKRTLGKTSRR
ncbi:nucleolar GTP-binding protein, putative [Theileria equi strain WA]|uniref:Nucleolar GTP-binding protein 1 n=1 Tax=Theileria equi strain WA TaxID=1537102 RepID=L0AVQ7_THEEQ|nr:nucleolar GTP-binding protein, putative [Theileria equi strain WA]AFZ79111.1 nucleolar GTP-binding protein, putative [Theileria equi strain WA]|eukprot:XP_004828777.1 nucleolar GTP-binding protein, putative [Theileria equi strain WA]